MAFLDGQIMHRSGSDLFLGSWILICVNSCQIHNPGYSSKRLVKYCRFKFFTSNWVYCKNSLNILQAYPKSFHFSYFKEFTCQKMRCANSILKQAQTMIIKTFWCSLEQHDDILRFEKLKPEHGKIIQSSKA